MNFISNLAQNYSILESLNFVASHFLQDIRKIYCENDYGLLGFQKTITLHVSNLQARINIRCCPQT